MQCSNARLLSSGGFGNLVPRSLADEAEVACRTGGLAGPARYASARAKREARKYPPVITPLFMLFRPQTHPI